METPYDNISLKTVHESEKMPIASDIPINIGAASSMGSSQFVFKFFDSNDDEIGNVPPLDGSDWVQGDIIGTITGFSQVPNVAEEAPFENSLDLSTGRAFAPQISNVSQFRLVPTGIGSSAGATPVTWQALVLINQTT